MKRKRNVNLLICVIILFLFSNFKNNINNKIIINVKLPEMNHSMPIYDDFLAKLEIPSIKLKSSLYKNNNVNKNIEILFPSIMPDKPNSTLILAAHSGNSNVSYFKNLDKLKLNDIAKIYYKNNTYIYKVINIERQNKNGYITIFNKDISQLILTTCDQKDKNKQLVIILEANKS